MTTPSISTSLSVIERSLEALWAEDGPGRAAATAHAATLNLIVVRGRDPHPDFHELVERVSTELAARTFMLHVEPETEPEPWLLRGEATAICRVVPGEENPQVCAERVELALGYRTAERVASVLDALVDARLPLVVYVGPGAAPGVVEALAPRAARVVVDSAEYGLARSAELARPAGAHVEDLAFVRGRRWREMLTRFFDAPSMLPALRSIRSISLSYSLAGECAWPSADAELLVSWLGTRLGWSTRSGKLVDGSGAEVEVVLRATEAAQAGEERLDGVTLHAELSGQPVVATVTREATGEHLVWSLRAPGAPETRQCVLAPHRQREQLVLRAISEVRFEPLAKEALRFARSWVDSA